VWSLRSDRCCWQWTGHSYRLLLWPQQRILLHFGRNRI